MITLAFYKGTGRLSDRVIRWVTRSPFSHVEMLERYPVPRTDGRQFGMAWSSSGRDGGVRFKTILFEPGRWVFVEVPWVPTSAINRIRAQMGKPYDFFGLIWSQLLNLRRHDQDRWFCSEICAHALGLASPQEFAPGDLYSRVLEMNRVYALGKCDDGGTARGSAAHGVGCLGKS